MMRTEIRNVAMSNFILYLEITNREISVKFLLCKQHRAASGEPSFGAAETMEKREQRRYRRVDDLSVDDLGFDDLSPDDRPVILDAFDKVVPNAELRIEGDPGG